MKRSWLERNPYWKTPLGFLTLVFLFGLFFAIMMTVVTASFRGSDVYQQALSQAAANSQVSEQIGEPIKPAWLVSGQLNVRGSGGNADLSIPISGPRGKGSIHAVANKTAGAWHFTYLQVTVEGQPASIDLLSVQSPAERDF